MRHSEGSRRDWFTTGIMWLISLASCQIRKIPGAPAPEMPGTFSTPLRVSDPHMHHGTCVTHVPWCMSGLPTSGFLLSRWRGKGPGIPDAWANHNFYLVRGPLAFTSTGTDGSGIFWFCWWLCYLTISRRLDISRMKYALEWRTVLALTRGLFWCLKTSK